ncbi:MAG: OmpA family protein [Cystobacter sp.]
MRGWKALTWGVLGTVALSGCMAALPRELVDARAAYDQAAAGPAAQFSPQALGEARDALDEANRVFHREKSTERARTLAYVALRRAQIAESLARAAVAQQERVQAEQQLAQARVEDVERTRRQLSQTRQELAEAQRLRTEAEQRQAEIQRQQEEAARLQAENETRSRAEREEQERQAKLAESQSRVEQLNAQLEQERQARAQAEQRANEAEAEARAQREVAAELRNIRQVQVKEETRGLVLTLSGSVLFRSGSVDLLPTARRRLNEVADALNKAQGPLVIEGHTDSKGSAELNEELSFLRAEAVRDYLVDRGVDAERIRTEGRGKERPIASNATAEGRANNRRVEIVLERGVGGSGGKAPADKP